jgi:hypothetical protein
MMQNPLSPFLLLLGGIAVLFFAMVGSDPTLQIASLVLGTILIVAGLAIWKKQQA